MIDDAGSHKQGRLEHRVIDDVEHRRHRRQICTQAQQQGDQTQMAHRGVGQEAFQVVLEQGDVGAHQHGGHTGERDRHKPGIGPRQHRIKPRQQKDTGFHHGGGMQIGRYRGGRRHGMGQPELEWKLG